MATLLSWLGRTDLDHMKADRPASIPTIALKGKVSDRTLANAWVVVPTFTNRGAIKYDRCLSYYTNHSIVFAS